MDIPNQNLKLKKLIISADEMDYLLHRWEIRDHCDLFMWGIKLLHDLSKLDEAGWLLTLTKSKINMETKTSTCDPNYKQMNFQMEWLVPNQNDYPRLPTPEMIEKIAKIEK